MQAQINTRHLNFNKFIQQRAAQIATFTYQLQLETKKTGHQGLPKTIRRRAMSHNRFRVPRRLRMSINNDLAKAQTMQKLPVCRKHIRKRKLLGNAYRLRSQKSKWLSTHLWSAKRMRMIDYSGYKIAQTSNDKCFRSAYRRWHYGALMVDLSYYNVLCISCKLNQNFPYIFRNKNGQIIKNIKNNQMLQCFLFNQKLICPGILLKCNQTNEQFKIRFLFNPIAKQQIIQFTQNYILQTKIQENYCDIYCLIGPQSSQKIQLVLKQLNIYNIDNLSLKLNSSNQIVYIMPINQFGIVSKPLITAPIQQQSMISQGYDSFKNKNIRKSLQFMLNSLQKKQQQPSNDSFWKQYQKDQNNILKNIQFTITNRSKYTHKRKNKLTKEQKRQIIKSDRQSQSQSLQHRSSPKTKKNTIIKEVRVNKAVAQIQQIKPLLIGQAYGGYIIMCSNFDNCKIWRALTHKNVKIIGRRQLNHYYLQKQIRKFPQDYPQTNSYCIYQQKQKNKRFQSYLKTPIQKRPHYVSLKSPYPFTQINKSSLSIVKIQMVSRGNCVSNSYICQLINDDLAIIKNSLQNGKIGSVFEEKPQLIQRQKYQNLSIAVQKISKSKNERKIIGKITSGSFLYSKSKPGGIGYINNEDLTDNYSDNFGSYILIRKPSSRFYFLGMIVKYF